ncbi:hypothetical protein JL720_11350 [Aureococcus anophagefferens]|nr:hypothetical protein JL720_11350 [Aureococcus anophagefferens]
MIARPKISRNERKTTEIGAFEVGNFAPFCCPGGRRDWARGARAGGAWTAPWLGPPRRGHDARSSGLRGAPSRARGRDAAGSPRPKGKGGGPPPASPATPHTAAMTAPLAPSVRTHDYPSDFLEKWAEAAGCRAVADKLPPHAMPVGAAQISACLEHLAPLAPRLRQRVAATPPPLALPPPAERGESTSSGAASPAPDSDDDVGFARARDARGVKASPTRAIRAALGAAGATKSSLDLALPLDDGTARDLCDGVGPALRRRRRARGVAAEAEPPVARPAPRRGRRRGPGDVRDANPLHAIELLASAACQGRRTLLPWSGEWADPQAVGNGGDDDPCEAMAEEMGLDILDVAGAVHRGREFVEPVLELGLGSAGNGLFRALALFGAELVAQCSAAADRAAAPAPAPADDDPADDPGADESVDAERRRGRRRRRRVVDEDRVAVEDGAPEDDDEDEEDEEEDDDDDDDDEARVLGGLGGSAEDDDDDDLDDDMDDLDDMDDPDGLDDDDESFAALAETLLARALLGRDKYAPKALMRAASMAAEGRVLPVVLVLAFEESVYVVLEARHDALLELSSPETLEACGPRGRSRSDSGADRDRVVIGSECWTGGGFGHVEVMMQLPQPLRLACDRSLLHHALLQLPPADAADDCTPWLTLALLPGADDLVAVPLAGLYVRTAAAGGLGAFGGGLALGDDAGAPPPLAAALVGDGVSRAGRRRRRRRRGVARARGRGARGARRAAGRVAEGAAYVAAAARVGEQADSAARDAGRARRRRRGRRARARASGAEARATALEASDDDEESDEPERRATVSRVPRHAPAPAPEADAPGFATEPDAAPAPAAALRLAPRGTAGAARRRRRRPPPAPSAPASPAALLLASFLGYRDGLKYNGPPLHSTTADALPPPPGGAAGAPPSPRPATELLKALAKCHEPHVKLCGRVVETRAGKGCRRRASGRPSATPRPSARRARASPPRCPKRALPSPLADGAAAKATTYLPHVHTLVATRRRPFLDDSSFDDALGSSKKKKTAGRAAAE